MALIKSTLLAQISGSLNGATFSHNRGGAYVRNRSMVSNQDTARQAEVRTALATLSNMWRDSLTQIQRDQWIAYGASVSVINRIGDTISLSGIAAFNRVNLFRVATLDEAPILTPPGASTRDPGVVVPSFVDAFFDGGPPEQYNITLTAPLGTDFGVAVYYSAPLSPGVKFFRGPYEGRVVTNVSTLNVVNITWPTTPTAPGTFIATRITLYDAIQELPIWTTHVAPVESVTEL